jgi:hypothetical protein
VGVVQLGWNLEHLRVAMGHAGYRILQQYVKLATERDLGSRKEWLEFIAPNPALSFDRLGQRGERPRGTLLPTWVVLPSLSSET